MGQRHCRTQMLQGSAVSRVALACVERGTGTSLTLPEALSHCDVPAAVASRAQYLGGRGD